MTGHVVDASERSVAGARITIPSSRPFGAPVVEIFAGADGAYTMEIDREHLGNYIDVEKDGFEPSHLGLWPLSEPGQELKKDLRLHEVLRIGAGESVELSIREGDSVCDEMDGWSCRRVRVVTPVAGMLTVEVPFSGSALTPGFFIRLQGPPHYDFRPSFRLAAAAGSETTLDVMRVGGSAGTTTLTTRFEPS